MSLVAQVNENTSTKDEDMEQFDHLVSLLPSESSL